MLEQLTVKDFALSHDNSLDFNQGMCAITGETGAGKSLSVDALSMLLGARADASMVSTGQKKAELTASFNLENNEKAQQYLQEHGISFEDNFLVLRRVITSEGKSKAYINNVPSTLTQLRELAEFLIVIHGQHASIKLINTDNQLNLLDDYGQLKEQREALKKAYDSYNQKRSLLQELADEQISGAQNYKNLRQDLELLNRLDLKQGDYESLSNDYDILQHQSQAQGAIALAQGVLENEEHNIIDILVSRLNDLKRVEIYNKEGISPVIENFTHALEYLDEARTQLDSVQLNASESLIEEISEKLSLCHQLAHRFSVKPEELHEIKAKLERNIEHFLSLKEQIAKLTNEVKELRKNYEELADNLSQARFEAALKMSDEVTENIHTLEMPEGKFKVAITKNTECRPRAQGRDDLVFLFNANKGEELKELGQVASGGELSRLALTIEVLSATASSTPTMIFDEVDSGISGRTASSVGNLLRKLGKKVQVITVTHLPQVAACAHENFLVAKEQLDTKAQSYVTKLDEKGRIEELARMMGGNVITDDTLRSAKQLLSQSQI